MKGITPVIAIILLLLITISMVGFAFIWFQRVAQTATTSSESQLTSQLNLQGQTVAIDNIDDTNNNVTLRHSGSVATDTSRVSVYVNNVRVTCAWDVPGAWAAGAFRACTVTGGFACTGTLQIRATAPGGQDSTTC